MSKGGERDTYSSSREREVSNQEGVGYVSKICLLLLVDPRIVPVAF